MTRLCPVGEVKRRIHFFNHFVSRAELIFFNYENEGGEYHVDEEDESSDADAGGEEEGGSVRGPILMMCLVRE